MALIDSFVTYDDAIYWAPTSRAGNYGRTQYAAPIAITVRWSDSQEKIMDAQGNEVISQSKVYTNVDVEPTGKLKHAELDSSTPDDPEDTTDVFEILKFDKIPNKKATKFIRKAYL